MDVNEKKRSTLKSLVKVNYQLANETGNWDNKDLIKYLTKLVLLQEKEIRHLKRNS